MNVKIISDLSGEMQFDMSAENLVQLIGAATRYAADDPAAAVFEVAKDAVQEYAKQPEAKKDKPARRVESLFGDFRNRIPIQSVVPAMNKQEESYKGFLLIKCDDCGGLRGFYAKNPTSKYYCNCGCETMLKGLVPLYLNCNKCGGRFKYMTNADGNLTYNCLDCGAPVDLELNKRGDTFVTVGNRF